MLKITYCKWIYTSEALACAYLESIFQLLALGIIQRFGSLHLTHYLTPLGSHDQAVRVDDTVQAAEATVLRQQGEQIAGGSVELHLSGDILQCGGLYVALRRRVTQQIAHLRIRAHLALQPLQILLDRIERLGLGGSGIERTGIAALQSEDLHRWLDQLSGGRASAQLTSL